MRSVFYRTENIASKREKALVSSLFSFSDEIVKNKSFRLVQLQIFEDNKSNFTQIMKLVLERIENTLGKKRKRMVFGNFPFPNNV